MAFLDEFNLLIKDYLADKISSDPIVSLMLENVSVNERSKYDNWNMESWYIL